MWIVIAMDHGCWLESVTFWSLRTGHRFESEKFLQCGIIDIELTIMLLSDE